MSEPVQKSFYGKPATYHEDTHNVTVSVLEVPGMISPGTSREGSSAVCLLIEMINAVICIVWDAIVRAVALRWLINLIDTFGCLCHD